MVSQSNYIDNACESRTEQAIRRFFDIFISSIALVVFSPVLVAVAIAVRLDSPGPAIFRQERVGRHGRPFTFFKFRGMFVDARQRWPELYDYHFRADQLASLRFHPEDDPRVTRVGRFLRRTSIDELLNFWNVVKGDMSIIGPRPEIPEMIPYYGAKARVVLSVKPGISSLAKCTGRDEHTFETTLALDVEYVRRRSLRLDVRVFFATIATVVLQRGVLPG